MWPWKPKPEEKPAPPAPPWWEDLEANAPWLVPYKELALRSFDGTKSDPNEIRFGCPYWVELADEYRVLHQRLRALRQAGMLDEKSPP